MSAKRSSSVLILAIIAQAAFAGGFCSGLAQAEEAGIRPIVRVEVEPSRVVVGQTASLRVTILAPSWFPRPPVYPDFELANAVIRLPADSSYPTSELVDGETWSGIIRDYTFVPFQAGRFRVAGESVRITFANPETAQAETIDVAMPGFELNAFVPEGAEDLDPFLSGRSLELSQEIEGDLDDLVAGSAIKRFATARIDGMAGMFLPPLIEVESRSGLSVYAGPARVSDETSTGIRDESATYVFEDAGRYDLAPIRLAYWNSETDQIETAEIPGVEVTVRRGGVGIGEVEGGVRALARPSQWPWEWIACFLVLALLGVRLRHQPSRALEHLRRTRQRLEASEPRTWQRLRVALRRDEPAVILQRYVEWNEHPDLRPSDSGATGGVLGPLRQAAFGQPRSGSTSPWSSRARREIGRALVMDRRARRRRKNARDGAGLPPLNPTVLDRRGPAR